MVKIRKISKGNCMQLKIDEVETKCGVRKIITITCVTCVQKDF